MKSDEVVTKGGAKRDGWLWRLGVLRDSVAAAGPEMDPGTIGISYEEKVQGLWTQRRGLLSSERADLRHCDKKDDYAVEHFVTDGSLKMPALALLQPKKYRGLCATRLYLADSRNRFLSRTGKPADDAKRSGGLENLAAFMRIPVNSYHVACVELKPSTYTLPSSVPGERVCCYAMVSQANLPEVVFAAQIAEHLGVLYEYAWSSPLDSSPGMTYDLVRTANAPAGAWWSGRLTAV